MSDSYKIDISALQHLHYDWFWGLRYSKIPRPENIGIAVTGLLKDEAHLTRIVERQHSLFQRNVLVRFFCWLFNINNYNYHGYLLAAYKEHKDYMRRSEGNSTMETNNNTDKWYGPLKERLSNFGKRISQALKLAPSKGEVSNALVKRDSEQVSEEAASGSAAKSFTVSALMQPYLAVLGIQRRTGDLLSLSDFKAACKAQYLASHPDKGGSATRFHQVDNAVKCMTKLMHSRKSTTEAHSFNDNPEEFWATFFAELRAELDTFWAEEITKE